MLQTLVISIIVVAVVANNPPLKLNQVQLRETHSSYHLVPTPTIPGWNSSQLPIFNQLNDEGVRSLDLQFWGTSWLVYDVLGYDQGTNCVDIPTCLNNTRQWSINNPTHYPIFIFISSFESLSPANWDSFDAMLLSIFPNSSIITPDNLRAGNATLSLQEAITLYGWPTIDSSRGKVVFVIDGDQADYLSGHVGSAGRIAFAAYDYANNVTDPNAVIFSIDDVITYEVSITQLVQDGYLVRTRPDIGYPGSDITASVAEMSYFQVIDTNHDNIVTSTEMNNFLLAIGINVGSEINSLYQACGSFNGQANYNVFTCMITTAAQFGYNILEATPTFQNVTTARDIALHSGAQFIETDFPSPPFVGANYSLYYWVRIPGGSPIRCNPIIAPNYCSSSSIENISSIVDPVGSSANTDLTSSSVQSSATKVETQSQTHTDLSSMPTESEPTSKENLASLQGNIYFGIILGVILQSLILII